MVDCEKRRIEREEKPLVSVVVPTHNRAELLLKALGSIYGQVGIGEQFEMEVIVVDDASSDETQEIVGEYPGVRYIRLARNRGEAGARNAGIEASTGKYVTFLDDDDVWLPHKLSIQVPVLEANPEIGVVYSQNIIRDEDKDVTWPDAGRAPSGYVFEDFLKREFISMNAVLVRREAFDKSGLFDEDLPTMTHYDMFLRLAFHVRFAFVSGNVAVNQLNKGGVFFVRLGREGGYAQMAPYVIEKALAMLSDTAESTRIKQETHASLVRRMLYWLGHIGEIGRMQSHMRTALQTCPWMLTEPLAKAALEKGLARCARVSDSPLAVVDAACSEIRATAGQGGYRAWLDMRRLLADVWAEVASGLRWTGSRRLDRAAAYAAVRAILHNPLKLGSTTPLRIVARALVGPYRDRMHTFLRRAIN